MSKKGKEKIVLSFLFLSTALAFGTSQPKDY